MLTEIAPSFPMGPTRAGQATEAHLFKSREAGYAWFVYGQDLIGTGPVNDQVQKIQVFGVRIDEVGIFFAAGARCRRDCTWR
jgi:hypothetical protein